MKFNYSAYFNDPCTRNKTFVFSRSLSQFKSKLIYYLSFVDIYVDGRASLNKIINICFEYLDDFHYEAGD